MNVLAKASTNWLRDLAHAWDRFWFTPSAPHTLSALRILAGGMLLYTHLVWSLDLVAFLGRDSWISQEVIRATYQDSFAWSYLWHIESPAMLWVVHILALCVFVMLTVGLWTRVTSILAALITLSYCHRLPGALFGLDQVNAMLATYLAVGPSGAVYSMDRWLQSRRAMQTSADSPSTNRRTPAPNNVVEDSVGVNIAIRLIQLHMCVIYLFGGIGKMRGEMWWDGSAVWYAVANYEYQSVDMTWLVQFPWLVALLTHATVFWETFYPFFVWPRKTRPVALILALFVHGGIALFLGMPTFGIAMLIGNLAFVSPDIVARIRGSKIEDRR